jgi:hypothetical protein
MSYSAGKERLTVKLSTIRKAVTAEFGALLLWAQLVPDFNHLSRGDYMGLAIAVGTGLGVYGATNATESEPMVLTGTGPPVFPPVAPVTRSPYVPVSDSLSHTFSADPPETHAPVAVVPVAPILP